MMKKIVTSVLFACLCGFTTTQAQVFTFECVGDFISGSECPECTGQTTERLFNGLMIKRNGAYFRNIDCPFIVRKQGNNLVFQEIIPNPESVTINLSGTGYSTIQGFMDSTACMCARQDSSWIGGGTQVLSAGDGGAATDKTILLSDGGGAVVLREGTNIELDRTADTITINSTAGGSANYQTWRDDGTPLTQRPNANFLQSADINLILADDAGNTETEVSADILPNAVDYAEIQQVSANRLLGNPTGSTANIVEVPLASGLFFAGGSLNVADRDSLNEAWTIDADDADMEVISNEIVKFAGAGINVTDYEPTTNTLTITGTEIDGSVTNELQTLNNTSDATSHTATLSNSGGSVQIVEGAGIALATTGTALDGIVTVTNSAPDQTVTIAGAGISVVTGTYPNFTVTSTEVDGSITNEGSLTVGAGGANTSTIVSNTSGGTPVTVSGSNTVLVTESGSTITLQADTSLLATVNDINVVRNRDDSTFARLPGELYHTKRISSNAYRYGTTGFRTTDTTGVVNVLSIDDDKPGVRVLGTTNSGIHYFKGQASGYTGLSNFGAFTINGQTFPGVNEPYSSRPNYVFNLGYNWATNATNEISNEQSVGLGFETFYQNASLSSGSTGFSEFHIRTRDTFGTEHRFVSAVEPWDGLRGKAQFTLTTDLLTFRDHIGGVVWQHNPLTNLFNFTDTTTMRFDEPRGWGLFVLNGASAAYMNILGFNNADQLEIGRQNTDGVRITPPTIIGFSATPARTLEVRGEARITDLTTDAATGIVGTDADGDLSRLKLGTGLSISNDTLYGTTGGSGTVTGTGASPQVAYWNGVSSLTGDANFTWSSNNLAIAGTKTHNVAGSYSASQNLHNLSGTITSTANSLTHRALYVQPVFANAGTQTNQFYTGIGGTVSTVTPTAATQLIAGGFSASNTSANVSQLYGLAGRVDENSTTGNLSNRYGLDFLVVKGAQDATDAHSGTGVRVRLQESTSTGRWATGTAGSFSVEDAATNNGLTVSLSNTVGTNATQTGALITNSVSNSGVTVANAYGLRLTHTESASGAFTNYYSIYSSSTPSANTNYGLYFSGAGWRNYMNGSLALGVDVTTAQLFVRGSGSTSATTSFQLEKQDGTDYFVAKDDGKIGIGNNTTLARELHVTGEVRITDVSTDTPTKILGVDADGDVDTIGIGAENELYFGGSGTLGTNFHTTISPAELTAGMTNNWNPTGLATAWIIRLSGDDGFELITGITAPTFNKRLTLHNVGANAVLLPTENQSSSAANRFAFGRDVILFPGKSCEIQYDVTSSRWRLLSQGGLYEDVQHLYANHVFTSPTSGTSGDYSFWEVTSPSISGISPVAGRWSGIGVNTGSSSTGLGYVASKDPYFENNNASGTATWAYYKAVIRTPSSLSDGTDDYTIRVGFNAGTGGSGATDGMYFNYNHGLSSGQWACHTTSGGNTQSNASGTTVSASTTYVLEVVFRTNLSVEFFINGTRVATNDTFIPTGVDMLCMAEIQKSAGTASREIAVYTAQTSLGLVK